MNCNAISLVKKDGKCYFQKIFLTPSLTISKVTCKQVKRDPNILSSHYSKLKWFSSGAFGEWGPFKTQSLYLSLIMNKIVATLLDKVTLLSCPLP